MSEHDNKRYFWLKLKEDFFDDDAISWLEEQNNGKEYALFYLKLCLKSLKNDGILIRKVGNILVPYDTKKIGEITRTDEDTVIVAMELLKKIGLIELQENGALYMTQLSSMIGSETNGAERKRRYREAQKALKQGDNVPSLSQACPENCPLELELELELEKDIEKGDNVDYTSIIHEVIDYLNAKVGTRYGYKSKASVPHIKARVNEGYTVEDFKTVIDNKADSWLGDKDMEKYLRPSTLFGNKFEGYLNERRINKKTDVDTGITIY